MTTSMWMVLLGIIFLTGFSIGLTAVYFYQASRVSDSNDSRMNCLSLAEVQVILTLCEQSHEGTFASVWNTALQTASERIEAYINGVPFGGSEE